MFFSISALIFQLAAGAFTVRMTTHPRAEGASKKPLFWTYFTIALAGVLATCGSIRSTDRSSRKSQATISQIGAELTEFKRPTLTPERLGMVKYMGDRLGVVMEVDNRGGGTAYKSHIFAMVSDVGATELNPDLRYSESESRGHSTIPAQSAMAFRLDSGIKPAELAKFMNRGDRIFFLGSLWWEDESGAKEERSFCFLYRQDGFFESRKAKTCKA